jgi:anthranilate phosphoribosyltransferase
MMNIKSHLQYFFDYHTLIKEDFLSILNGIQTNEIPSAQVASFLTLMNVYLPIELLSIAVDWLYSRADLVDLNQPLLDIVGTGGDGLSTLNISTIASFVIASCGVSVAKHGNVSVSSQSGSADFLKEAGFSLNYSVDQLKHAIQTNHVGFLFAPNYHKALHHLKPIRQALGFKTFFNLLGPLVNPAKPTHMVMGVYDERLFSPLIDIFNHLKTQKCILVHAKDGMDEISISAETTLLTIEHTSIHREIINPTYYGMSHANNDGLIINNAKESLSMALDIFHQGKGAHRDAIVLNAALGLQCAGKVSSFENGIEMAKNAIDAGDALNTFEKAKQLLGYHHE